MKESRKFDRSTTPLLLGALAGTSLLFNSSTTPTYANPKHDRGSKVELKPPLSLTKIRDIELKILRLYPGTKNVLDTLRMANYTNPRGIHGSGPRSNYGFSYYLRKGYSLMLVYDLTKKPAFFKNAEMRKVK